MSDINDIDGRPAIETDKPMSIQEASLWALEQRDKTDTRKAAIERLRCDAAKRRERKPANPLETLKPDPSYRVREFNAEADAFNVDGSDGKKLLGKSLSNGNVRNGQKVRSFFAPNGQVVIDVKPKGRDIVIPKPEPKPPTKDEEYWPVTSCFLYSRIKGTEEDLTDNLATDITSYDAKDSWYTQHPLYDPSKVGFWGASPWNDLNAPPVKNISFIQRPDSLGDYETAQDAVNNNLKTDRTFQPPPGGAGDGGDADNSAWGEGSEDAVTAWFYIGDTANLGSFNRNIFYARGNGFGSWSGPDYLRQYIQGPASPCMTMYGVGAGATEALYASLPFGGEPLSKYLKQSSFQGMGGRIGYWGAVHEWHGMQDYVETITKYDRRMETWSRGREPTSVPPDYLSSAYNAHPYPPPPAHPWGFEHSQWFRFGWPRYSPGGGDGLDLNCASEPGNIRVYNYGIDPFSTAAGFECGGSISGDQWSGYRTGNHTTPLMQYGSGPSLKSGMFVCWQGTLVNIGMASSFCAALNAYWSIDTNGGVTLLGSCNPYGCKGPPGTPGNGYPKAPLSQRKIAKQFGHKAEIWLKVCEKEKPPIELKLPFEFAAVVTRVVTQNGVFANNLTEFQSLETFGTYFGRATAAECPHATMSVDKDFVYVDIFYGGEREWAVPQIRPVPTRLLQAGTGMLRERFERQLSEKERNPSMLVVGEHNLSGKEPFARYKADYFTYCQSFKIALPKPPETNLIIVANQRYQRGQTIQITEQNPDNEFNNKFLICDFRTDMDEPELIPSAPSRTQGFLTLPSISSVPNPDYASFGGLPALLQGRKERRDGSSSTLGETLTYFNAVPKFYKPQSVWTDMDKIHFQLQESPRMIWPGNTVLPFGEFVDVYSLSNGDTLLFDDNGKFGKHGRASVIVPSSLFGWPAASSPNYGDMYNQDFLLYTSFKEQLIGNGLKNDAGLVVKWNRVSTSSFPIFGQLQRN